MHTFFEERCKIKDIENARKTAELMGGIFKGYYSSIDIIFKPKKADSETGVIVLRVFKINNRSSKNFILTQKLAEWIGKIKTDKILLKKDFETMEEAVDFILYHYGEEIKENYAYSREGWEYHLDKNRIFIENIEKLGPTMEIESENKNDLDNLLKYFEPIECFTEPVSEIMRKLLEI